MAYVISTGLEVVKLECGISFGAILSNSKKCLALSRCLHTYMEPHPLIND